MNSIHEGIIDKRIRQTVSWAHESDTTVKYACIAAAQVVGTYSDATKQIAEQSRRSVSTVQNWAHAFRLYVELRREYKTLARALWRFLPASHWWLAYDIQVKGYDAMHYLGMANRNNMSGRDMIQEYKVDMEAGNAPMVLARAFVAFQGLADELMKPLSEGKRKQAERLLREFIEVVK